MNIIIRSSSVQFKNPQTGHATKAIREHYIGRLISVDIDGMEQTLSFKKDEMPFIIEEDGMRFIIEERLKAEQVAQ